ncbi:universal stress protein [Streptomyces pini]|uniref:Nucleotide-binding universal stress protein, UspA family n=1 Tax=Streptomyces pini TaxID=1520580 RepID=A0A1I4D036_9ACTN|nr:universal stress protein [Streptomyces pini]SFK85827.1 Nucleotide-binding universal stress protein, UspA family [Streptomyces pini]
MNDIWLVLITVAVWITAGLLAVWWMARRGHGGPGWLLMGVVFGPILALVAGERVRRRPAMIAGTEVEPRGSGGLRVLVGVDGSPESRAALGLAVDLLGPYTKTLVAAQVVDYDTAELDRQGRVAEAERRLGAVAEEAGGHVTACEVLAGPPAAALARFAGENDIDVVVVGRHGRGLSKRLLGNVAQELLRDGSVPVLVTGGRADGAGARAAGDRAW